MASLFWSLPRLSTEPSKVKAILKEFLIALQPVLFAVLMVRTMTAAVGPLILPLGGIAFIGLLLRLWLCFKP